MNSGDTFLHRGEDHVEHLWVIVSDPNQNQQKVLIIHVTTFETYKEDVCLLDVGDHPRIKHASCMAYNRARLVSLDKLTELRDSRLIAPQASVSADLLARIRSGANQSKLLKLKYQALLEEQGLIDY